MSTALSSLREALCRAGRSFFERGLTHGATGNLSVRAGDGFLMTPTGVSLGELDAARLALLDAAGEPVAGDAPTKERGLHLAFYARRPRAQAIAHLHSHHATAVSVLADVDPDDVLPPITAYHVMRVGRLPLVPYVPPGDPALATAVGERAADSHALLLANHGPIAAGASLAAACETVEEIEATARLHLALHGRACRCLDAQQVAELRRRFPPGC
jgi:ribulose-5-phosphate 4-epimerase/fuculose-1-phosphate aldolase